jgi:hypothetical protein
MFYKIKYIIYDAFRKGHGCQTTLLRLLEDWKQALDCNEYIAAILMDLSKAMSFSKRKQKNVKNIIQKI